MAEPTWSIILPTLNEGENIGPLLERLSKLPLAKNAEFLVVDGGSSDSTRDAVMHAARKLKQLQFIETGPGKGLAVRIGFARAKGKYLAFMDTDLQYPPEQLPRVCRALEDGADLVVTRRCVHQSDPLRRALSLGYSKLIGQAILDLPATDPQSGMKAIRASIIPALPLSSKGWELDTELIVAASSAGARIEEVEIDFHPRESGRTKTHLVHTSLQLLNRGLSMAFSRHPRSPKPHSHDSKAIRRAAKPFKK